jgi:hypothetical protein
VPTAAPRFASGAPAGDADQGGGGGGQAETSCSDADERQQRGGRCGEHGRSRALAAPARATSRRALVRWPYRCASARPVARQAERSPGARPPAAGVAPRVVSSWSLSRTDALPPTRASDPARRHCRVRVRGGGGPGRRSRGAPGRPAPQGEPHRRDARCALRRHRLLPATPRARLAAPRPTDREPARSGRTRRGRPGWCPSS